jgi:hypothetical protein
VVRRLSVVDDYEKEEAKQKRVMIIDPDKQNCALFESLLHERYIV